MNRGLRKGYLEIDFSTVPFDSIGGLLVRATRLYFSAFVFIAAITLIVNLPGKLAMQVALDGLDIRADGVLGYILMDLSDLALAALVAPALIFGLVDKLGTAESPALGESLRWGYRQWGKMLWNRFKAEVTITLWSALLLVPGIVAMMKLMFVEPVVAIEGDGTSEVLQRSRNLSEGHRWRIFFAVLPALPLSLLHLYAGLRALQYSRYAMAPVDAAFTILDQWMLVVVLLIYLGLIPPRATQKKKAA